MLVHHKHTQMADEIPRWWDPGTKGSLASVRSGRRGHRGRGCGGGQVVSPRGAQGEGLGAEWWHRNWGVGRNRGPSGARRGFKETNSSVSPAGWGRSPPGRGDRVGPIALGDGEGGRWRVERVSRSSGNRWNMGNNELWGRGGRGGNRCRRCSRGGKRRRSPLGYIQSHWVRTTTPIQTVDNIDKMIINKNNQTPMS